MPLLPETERLDLNIALRSVSQRAQALTGASAVAIALAHKGSMICRSSLGSNAPSLGCRLDVSSGFSGECVRSGKALRCDDSENDIRVDLSSCRRLGIRSILAVPILANTKVLGIMEVFSPHPNAFSETDAVVLNTLVETLFAPLRHSSSPELLPVVKTEPACIPSVRNLAPIHAAHADRDKPLTSAPDRLWSDVFVPYKVPWRHFGHSVLLHVMLVACVGSILRLDARRPHLVPPALNSSDVVYLPAEYLSAPAAGKHATSAKRAGAALAGKLFSVPREHRRRTDLTIPAPSIRVIEHGRVLDIIAWHIAAPPPPTAAVGRDRLFTPVVLVRPIAPPPSLSGVLVPRTLVSLTAAIVAPPPTVGSSFRHVNLPSMGSRDIVRPAPKMPTHGQNSSFAALQSEVREALVAVVGPPPSLVGAAAPSAPWAQSVSTAPMVVPPPPQVIAQDIPGRWASSALGTQVIPPSPSFSDRLDGSALAKRLPNAAPEVMLAKRDESAAVTNHPADSTTYFAAQTETGSKAADKSAASENQLSVALISAVLPLPSSSFFSSSEIFVAEERLSNHISRLIKLVYDFLPYQRRLSDYGPDYPEVDKLHVTRDHSCDETLAHMASTSNALGDLGLSKAQSANYVNRPQTILPCFRTTADDYRKARLHKRN